jgi:hypothetical protein
MKKFYTLLFLALFLYLNIQGQVTGDFRSKAGGTGNWSDFNAWETYSSGAWVAATTGQLPTSTSTTTIQAGQTMAINAVGMVSGSLSVIGTLINDATPLSSLNCGAVTVATTGKLWLSNAGTTITSNSTGTITGTLQIDAGTVNMGTSTTLTTINGNLNLNGASATLNIIGGLYFYVSSYFTMTNGNINIDPQSLPATLHVLEFQSYYGTGVIATGGMITIVNPGINQNSFPQIFVSGSGQSGYNFAGSTLRFGDGVSTKQGTAGIGFSICTNSGVLGNVIVNNPAASTNRMVRLYGATKIGGNLTINSGAGNIFQLDGMYPSQLGFQLTLGGNLINNGTFNSGFTGSSLVLNGTTQQTLSGAGTYSLIRNLTQSNTSLASPAIDEQVNLNVTDGLTLSNGSLGTSNGSVLTLGNSTANATMAINGAGGSMTLVPTFAPSGVTFNATYSIPTPAANITTGNELPSILNGTLKINNTNFVVINSGVTLNKPVSCNVLNLTAGILTTTGGNGITITGTTIASLVGGSSTVYVNGPLTRTIPSGLIGTTNNYKFPVGKTAYHLFEYENITTGGTGNGTYTVESFDAGSYTGTAGYGLSTINTDKYWTLNGSLGATTILSSKIRLTDAGLVSTNKIGQSNSANGVFTSDGGILETGTTLSSVKVVDYSAFPIGTFFRTGLIGAGITPGNYAIGPNGPYAGYLATYTSVQLAANDLSDIALGGNFVFEFQPDYSPSVEVYPINFPQTINGTSSASITFRPSSGVISLINFSAANTILTNAGAGYIIFDGRPGGVGSNKYIQFTNTTVAGATPTVSISGASTNDQFLYCILKGSNTSGSSGVLSFNTTVTGNNSNIISYCNFDGSASASNCLYAAGNGSGSGSTISYNNFFDFRNGSALNLNSGDNAVIDNNSIYQTTAYNGIAGTTNGINIGSGTTCTISNNNIGGSGPGLTGIWTITATTPAAYNFYGINAYLPTAGRIFNNKIQNFDWKCQPASWNGINVSGSVNIGTDGGNIIGSNTGNDNIKITYYSNGAGLINGISDTGTSRFENNIIGSITTVLASGITGAGSTITAISAGGLNTVINNNTIGSTTTTNSINAGNQSTTGFFQNLMGIFSNSSTSTISNNTIANIYSGMLYKNGGSIKGISQTGGSAVTISGNTIYSFSTPQPNVGISAAAILTGIDLEGTSGISITGNTIYDLVSTDVTNAAVSIYGICYNSGAGSNKVDKNYIQSFSSLSNAATQSGLYINTGGGAFQNNVIRLGIDNNGNPITSTAQINGIAKTSTSASNFYFNTVYIGGTGVAAGAIKTYAFSMSNKATTLEDVRNNIFVNMRTNAVANKLNYAVSLPAITTNPWLSDYNIYNTSSTDGILSSVNAVDYTNLGGLKAVYVGADANSGLGDPLLTNPSATMASMSLIPTNLTPAEGTGIAITGIDDDFTGLIPRSSVTPTDIGAYAGNFTPATTLKDIFYPVITYSPLVNTGITTGRTLNPVTITDNTSGVNVTPGTKPRLYFKLSTNVNAFAGNTSASNGWKWVEPTTNATPFSFVLDYSLLYGGPVVSGNIIQYFIAAQDLASIPNVTFTPGAGAVGTGVGTIATAPTNVNSYTIDPTIASAITVGTGFTYPTLTGTGGLFDAMNNGVINTNIVATIKTNITETGTVSLNQILEEGSNAGTLTLTIQSDGVSHIVSGTAVTSLAPMVSITGAKRFTIDGGAGKFLTFRNTNTTASATGPVIQYNSSSQTDVLTNCIIESNGNLSDPTVGAVTIGTTGINVVTINNCDIRDARGGTIGSPSTGISSNSATNTLTITNNNIYNFKNSVYYYTGYGIYLPLVANGCSLTGNSIYMESGMNPISPLTGIYLAGSNNTNTISTNFIGGQSPSCGGGAFTITGNANGATYNIFNGINILATTAGTSIQGNVIQNITMNSAGSTFNGINDANYGPVTVTGNTIGSATTLNSINIAGVGTSVGIFNNNSTAFYASVFDNNTIANITLTSTSGVPVFNGMKMEGGMIRKNKIFNIGSSSVIAPKIYGIYNVSAVQNSTNEYSNNLISLNAGSSTAPVLYGYYDTSTTNNTGFYYNSINLYGTATGSVASYAYYNTSATAVYILNNNVLVNTRTGGTGIHYAIFSLPTVGITSNYNDLFVSGATLGHFGAAGVAHDYANLTTWRTASGKDANSISADPLFTSSTNLLPLSGSPVNGSGIPIASITTDITGGLRNLSTPALGAYEVVVMNKTLNLSSIMLEGLYSGGGIMRQAQDGLGNHWPVGVADHITVELHDATTYATIVYTVTDVPLSTTGVATVSIPVIYNGNYYITIKHRSSIQTVSATAVSFSGSTENQSFGTPANVYGGNLVQMVDLKYVMFGGDVNQDGIIDGGDFAPVDNLVSLFSTGYLPQDVNGDGLIDGTDFAIIDNNASSFVGSVTPP